MPRSALPQLEHVYDGYKMRALVDALEREFISIDKRLQAGAAAGVHNDLTGRSAANAHPISAITALQAALDSKFSQADGAALTITVNGHEVRITANEAALVALNTRVTTNEASITSQGARITANEDELDFARTQRYFFGE